MKKSLGAILIIFLTFLGANAFAAKIETKLSKLNIQVNEGMPGHNGTVKNAISTKR